MLFACALTAPLSVRADAAVVPGGLGYDISWPQCGQAFPADHSEVDVVGVTDGHPFSVNPCLASEAAWAGSGVLPLEVYVNLNWPTAAQAPHGANGPRGACASGDLLCEGYNYGYNAAADAVQAANGAGVSAQVWWLDVETGDNWSGNAAANSAVIHGGIDGLRALGRTAGIYSITHMWTQLTNGLQLPDVPVWVPGPAALDYAGFYCNSANSFDGGPIWMVQYPRGGLDGDLLCATQSAWASPPAWHGGQALSSGGAGGVPVTVSPSAGVVEVLWRGTDDALWHAWLSGGAWHGPQSLGGVLTSDPSAVSPSPGVVDVFYRGADHALWHTWESGAWQGPERLGDGVLATPPEAVARGAGVIDVVWRSRDQSLMHAWYDQGWNAAQVLVSGAVGDGQPFAVSSAPGQVDVVWRGADGNLWDVYYLGGWQTPVNHGYGPLGSDPRAAGWGDGHLEVFWAGAAGDMWEALYAPGYGWDDNPRLVSSQLMSSLPVAVSWGPGDADIYYRGRDNMLWHHWFGRTEPLNDGPTEFTPSAAITSTGTVVLAWRAEDGNIWTDWYG